MIRKIDGFWLDETFDMGVKIQYKNEFSILIAFTRWCKEDKYTLHRWIGSNLKSIGIESEINLDENYVIKIVGVDEL